MFACESQCIWTWTCADGWGSRAFDRLSWVSCLQEGVQLRLNGISIPILVLGAIHESQIEYLERFNLEFSISSKYKAELVAKN